MTVLDDLVDHGYPLIECGPASRPGRRDLAAGLGMAGASRDGDAQPEAPDLGASLALRPGGADSPLGITGTHAADDATTSRPRRSSGWWRAERAFLTASRRVMRRSDRWLASRSESDWDLYVEANAAFERIHRLVLSSRPAPGQWSSPFISDHDWSRGGYRARAPIASPG
jgi:hypothetical protein